MAKCCGGGKVPEGVNTDPCRANVPDSETCPSRSCGPITYFDNMIANCLEYAESCRRKSVPLVGIMCEFTPREVIMAAGAVPVCLCGGSSDTIPTAEEDLPSNLCPLIKSTYGYAKLGTNPFLEMAALLVAETTCDGKKKMYELLATKYPMHVLELPQKPDDPDAFSHWTREIVKLREELERHFSVRITDDGLRDAAQRMNRERSLKRKIAEFMRRRTPSLSGLELLKLKSSIACIPSDLDQYEKIVTYLETKDGVPVRKGPRVMLTGVPLPHGAERVAEIIEERGGTVVVYENCTGLKPIVEDVDDKAENIIEAIAKKYFHLPCSVMTTNRERGALITRLAREYAVDCVIDLVWQACITYDVESATIGKIVRDDLKLPYLVIGTDYSPSDSARIATRIDALFETIGNGR